MGVTGRVWSFLAVQAHLRPWLSSAFLLPPHSLDLRVSHVLGHSTSVRAAGQTRRQHLTATTGKIEVTADLVRKTAKLAQLEITEEEVEKLVPRFQSFLGFVEAMDSVDTEGAEKALPPSSHGTFLREDERDRFPNDGAILENMPEEENGYLRIPRVGEEEPS